MNKGIVFSGSIFIILFVVLQIAFISTLGIDANLNLDRMIAIFSGLFSLFGGIIGATGAYFIAKEQIKKQVSLRKMDLKLEKLSITYKNILIVKECTHELFRFIEDVNTGKKDITELEIKRLKLQEEVNKSWEEITGIEVFLMFFLDQLEIFSTRKESIDTFSFSAPQLVEKVNNIIERNEEVPCFQSTIESSIIIFRDRVDSEIKKIVT